MKTYGETIYETRGGFVAPHDWGVTTQKGNRLFVHVLNCADRALFVPTGNRAIKSARLFSNGKSVKFTKSEAGITLLFDTVPTDIDYVVELTMKQ